MEVFFMKSLKGSLFLTVWVSLLSISIAYAEEVENIARNPSFEDGVAQWQLLITPPAAAKWEVEKEGIAGECVYIDVSAVTGTDWHVEIHQGGQALKAGQEYTFNFWAKTADVASRPIGPGMEGIGGGADWWETFNITEEWKEFSKTWVQAANGSATIHFGLGQVKGDVWLDHIRLYEGDYQEEDLEQFEGDQAVELKGKLTTTWGNIKAVD
jgi:hypothetical protein